MGGATLYMLSRHDRDGRFVAATGAVVAVSGRDVGELVGAPLQSLVVAEDAGLVADMLVRAADGDEPIAVRCRIGERALEIVGHAARAADGAAEIHCLTRDVTDEAGRAAQVDVQMRRQALLLASVPGVVWARWDIDTPNPISYVSDHVVAMTGYTPEEWNTRQDFYLSITHPDDRERLIAESPRAFMQGHDVSQFRWVHRDGRVFWVEAHLAVVRRPDGRPSGVCGVTLDITLQKEAEAARARMHEEVLSAQERVLADLSAPLIPLGGRALVMPLIGVLDGARAERVIDTLLHGVASAGARVAIVDITGVATLDTRGADALLRAARGVRLLGAEVVLTGIRPDVAQALVDLGADLQGIVTRNTLEAGIRYAIDRNK